jgi:hypothetical protein
VQSPGYSQSYNRYSYCLNNPLKYTDPSGYTQININSIIELLLSSHYGGSWSQSGGLHFFSSNEEAIEAAIGSLNNTPGSWSHTEYKNEQTTREIYRFISSTPYNSDLLRGILFGLYYVDYHPSTGKYYYVNTNNEVDLISILRGEIANLEMEKEASSDGGISIAGNGYSEALYWANAVNSLYGESTARNLKVLEKEAAGWVKVAGKVPGRINNAIEAEKFTSIFTKSVGKKLYGVGLVFSAVDIFQDPSASNIAWNVTDNLVGLSAFIPGMQIPAIIYFTARISYDIYEAYTEP